jgi:primosomal protein N'
VDQDQAAAAAKEASSLLRKISPESVEVSEAAPAPLEKSHGQYRYHVAMKAPTGAVLGRLARELALRLALPPEVVMTIDVDPCSMM